MPGQDGGIDMFHFPNYGEKKKDWYPNPFSNSIHPITSYSSTPGISASPVSSR